jgi:hypothetical protein
VNFSRGKESASAQRKAYPQPNFGVASRREKWVEARQNLPLSTSVQAFFDWLESIKYGFADHNDRSDCGTTGRDEIHH